MISIQSRQKMFKFHSTIWWYLLFMLISFNINLLVSAKSLENLNYARKEEATCEHVKSFFDSINVTINPPFDKTGKSANTFFFSLISVCMLYYNVLLWICIFFQIGYKLILRKIF